MLPLLIEHLEYLLMFVVIVECNSMYIATELTDMDSRMPGLLYVIAIGILAVLVVLHCVSDRAMIHSLRDCLPLCLFILGYAALFYWLNVRLVQMADRLNYIKNFLLLLPCFLLLFKIKQQQGEAADLLYKYSDIACIVATVSLIVYLISVFHVDRIISEPIYTHWSNRGDIEVHINLLNICQLKTTQKWQISNVELLSNYGFFAEPLMFSIPLITSLYTELFLRPRSNRIATCRSVVLSLAILSANATICVMLMAVAWALKSVAAFAGSHKRWWSLLPFLAAAAVCLLLIVAKKDVKYEGTEVSGSSIGDHIEDIRAGLKAFLHRPLLGGGYNDESYILHFMRSSKVARNPGLSNSATTVLGEGGAMLGLLCMAPFLIFPVYLFRKGQRNVALWACGPLGLYIGVIFVYRIYLVFLVAFSISLLEFQRSPQGHGLPKCRPIDLCISSAAGFDGGPERKPGSRVWPGVCAAIGGAAILVWIGAPVCRGIHVFLRAHQFSMSQSPLKAFCFSVTILFHLVWLRQWMRHKIAWPRVLWLILWDAVYMLLYPRLYADAASVFQIHGLISGRWEAALLFGTWCAGAFGGLAWPSSAKKIRRIEIFTVCVSLSWLILVCVFTQTLLRRAPLPDEAVTELLTDVTDAAQGPVFSAASPSLFHRVASKVSLSATGTSGFEGYRDATILYSEDSDREELFEHGFQVSRVTEGYLLYSNDAAVIDSLSQKGYRFYRYYPFTKQVDMALLAEQNGVTLNEDGRLPIDHASGTTRGPSQPLQKGQYTVQFALHIDPSTTDGAGEGTAVCNLIVGYSNGKKDIALTEVSLGQFDEQGNALVDLPFGLSAFQDGMEYKVAAREGQQVDLCGMTIRSTPDHIATITYNGYRNPIREEYYNIDGSPYVLNKGYSILEREYNLAGMIRKVSYYDAQERPVLISGGYAQIRYGYNRKRTKDYKAYYGTDGSPILLSGGYAAVKTDYDAYGNAVRIRYLGTDLKPVMLKKGYAEIRRVYDAFKQILQESYFDAVGEPAYRKGGYCAIRYEYNDQGKKTAQLYLDDGGRPVVIRSGYARIGYAYDSIGRLHKEEFFDIKGRLTLNTSGYAIREREYDEKGKEIEVSYYGIDGMPLANKKGVAIIRREYDRRGRCVAETYYDAQGAPTQNTSGVAQIRRTYDKNGKLLSEEKLDLSGEPV